MNTKTNSKKMNLSCCDVSPEICNYRTYLIMDEDCINSDTVDAIVAGFDTRIDFNGRAISMLCLVDNQLFPISFVTLNRKKIKELYGSMLNFFKDIPNLLVKLDILPDNKVKYVNNTIGLYTCKVDSESRVSLYCNQKLFMLNDIRGINSKIYQGLEFRFIRYYDDKQAFLYDNLALLDESEFKDLVEQQANELTSSQEVAVIIPRKLSPYLTNRKLLKLGKSKLASQSLRSCFARYKCHQACGDINLSIAEIYTKYYILKKKEKNGE